MSCDLSSSFVWSNLCLALNNDFTNSTSSLMIWHSVRQTIRNCWLCFFRTRSSKNAFHPISAHRSLFAATIDVFQHLGIALNSDSTITTNQSSIAMCFLTLTGTEYATINNRCAFSGSYRHLRIPFYSAHFTATIDITIHNAVTDADFRSLIFIFI